MQKYNRIYFDNSGLAGVKWVHKVTWLEHYPVLVTLYVSDAVVFIVQVA